MDAPPFPVFTPSYYRVRVQGCLPPALTLAVGGMRVAVEGEGWGVVTEMVGPVRDQAALLDLLTALADRLLPILLVERLAAPAPGRVLPPLDRPGREATGSPP